MSARHIKHLTGTLILCSAFLATPGTAAAEGSALSLDALGRVPLLEKLNNLFTPLTPTIAAGSKWGGGARGSGRGGITSGSRPKMGRTGHTYSYIAVQGRLRYSNHSNGYAFKMRRK